MKQEKTLAEVISRIRQIMGRGGEVGEERTVVDLHNYVASLGWPGKRLKTDARTNARVRQIIKKWERVGESNSSSACLTFLS